MVNLESSSDTNPVPATRKISPSASSPSTPGTERPQSQARDRRKEASVPIDDSRSGTADRADSCSQRAPRRHDLDWTRPG
ncbi:hypothetical protein Cob_v010477 [Colletotrichum orbiculare MAFF 240422]|uniref:Uncharacterized protein n=1 Tax=Colletotrichum orbiculare (strain 104-T / ATCC 96160 / CBS 514.97 / LARS 414 / MAFF 240422) TaxID=1213857 RepID=A0A484FG61_COLOR|nr:hypothetical protein Cob_v010477 [Colletotrichum orbiculare MAFF 240422]